MKICLRFVFEKDHKKEESNGYSVNVSAHLISKELLSDYLSSQADLLKDIHASSDTFLRDLKDHCLPAEKNIMGLLYF